MRLAAEAEAAAGAVDGAQEENKGAGGEQKKKAPSFLKVRKKGCWSVLFFGSHPYVVVRNAHMYARTNAKPSVPSSPTLPPSHLHMHIK